MDRCFFSGKEIIVGHETVKQHRRFEEWKFEPYGPRIQAEWEW